MRRSIPSTFLVGVLASCAHSGPPRGEPVADVKIGRCTGVAGLEETRAAGFDYAELGVSEIARMSEPELEAALATHKRVGLPTPVANGFLPGEVRVTGPDANAETQLRYLRTAFDRMARFGVKLIVFGSSGARNVPEGFPREQAWQQLVEFGTRAAKEAQARGLVVNVEPLRKQESNIINTAAEGLKLVREINHPHFQLMVDFYHLAIEKEDPDILLEARDHIRHFHFANPNGRVFPLDAAEFDYRQFFENVRKIGFRGGLSVEGRPSNGISQDGPRTVAFLRSAIAGTAPPSARLPEGTAIGAAGLVSSAHPLASEAGLNVLRAGGNAFDAAVATAAALGVVEPMMSGIGGYGTILVYDAEKRQARFLNSSGRIPRAVDSDAFRPPTPDYLGNRRGAKSVSTPGTVASWEAMSRQYGKLPWKRLFEDAIRLAQDGFTLGPAAAQSIRASFDSFPEQARRFYGRDRRPLAAGERLVQQDLARSLNLIAGQGSAVVQSGEIARAIDSAMRGAGGFLSIADLESNRAEWGEPISLSYRGYEVVTAPPPANAFDMLVRLGLMSRYDLRTLGHNSPAYLHRFAEATKHGFWVRLRHAGDPEVLAPPLTRLLSPRYFAEEGAKIDLDRASPFEAPQAFQPERHTTHFVVADRWGNVVSATQTLGGAFGCKIMPEGTGIWLNDSLEFCTFEPKGNPMDAHAGRRKLSGDCPTLIMKDGRPWVAIGTPGGHTIGQTVPQMIMNLIDFGMEIQPAIAAGRVSFVEPDILVVEDSIPEEVRRGLGAMGHKVRAGRALGNAHGLMIDYDRDGKPTRFRGASDPRGSGRALAY